MEKSVEAATTFSSIEVLSAMDVELHMLRYYIKIYDFIIKNVGLIQTLI